MNNVNQERRLSVAWQMLCWLCKPTEIDPQKPHLESCVKKNS